MPTVFFFFFKQVEPKCAGRCDTLNALPLNFIACEIVPAHELTNSHLSFWKRNTKAKGHFLFDVTNGIIRCNKKFNTTSTRT